MWTIVWIDADGDHYERLDKEAARNKVKELLKCVSEDDILCFPPDSEVSAAHVV